MGDAPEHTLPLPEPSSEITLPGGTPRLRKRIDGRRVTLCVSGSVAAYKAVLLLRLLLKEGADVEVVLTESAQQFVGAATFSGLCGRPVHQNMFAPGVAGELHI